MWGIHAVNRGADVPQGDVFKESEGGMDLRPQDDHRHQRDHGQDRTHQSQRLGADGVQIDLRIIHVHRAFGTVRRMRRFLFASGALRQDIGAALLGAVEGDTAPLDQHPATDNMVNHQQEEPDGYRGFQTRQQRLRRGQVTDGRCQRRQHRSRQQQPPQRGVDHVLAGAFLVQIQRDAGTFQAVGYQGQCQTQQDKAQPAEGAGKFALFQAVEGNQRHDQRHDQPDRHLVVTHGA
ncbi:hypothetical protein D3C79_764810 [compost metagenome]